MRLLEMAREIAASDVEFQKVKGPGQGNRSTNSFMQQLRQRVETEFGDDVAERKLCGENSLAVDFYFEAEATIVEVALGLPNPASEFEKDVLKAIIAQDNRFSIKSLMFISRPGGKKKCEQPGRRAVRDWLKRSHGIRIELHELAGPPRSRSRAHT